MAHPVLGVFLLAIGLASFVWPYRLARFEEQIDSIGSKRSWSKVEPADWKVSLTRWSGVAFALFGALVVLGGY